MNGQTNAKPCPECGRQTLELRRIVRRGFVAKYETHACQCGKTLVVPTAATIGLNGAFAVAAVVTALAVTISSGFALGTTEWVAVAAVPVFCGLFAVQLRDFRTYRQLAVSPPAG